MPDNGSRLLFSFTSATAITPVPGDCGTDYHLKGECSVAGLFKKTSAPVSGTEALEQLIRPKRPLFHSSVDGFHKLIDLSGNRFFVAPQLRFRLCDIVSQIQHHHGHELHGGNSRALLLNVENPFVHIP